MDMNPTTAARESHRDSTETIHRRVLEAAIDLSRRSHVVRVRDVATRLEKDPRTVQHHLGLLEAAGRGLFVDQSHQTFALTEKIQALAEQAERNAFLRAGYAAANRIGWEPEDDEWDV